VLLHNYLEKALGSKTKVKILRSLCRVEGKQMATLNST
jgi:hypothetical protein